MAFEQFSSDLLWFANMSSVGSWSSFVSNFQSAGARSGQVYIFEDAPYSHAIWDGSAWRYYLAGVGRVTPPPTSGWTTVNLLTGSLGSTIPLTMTVSDQTSLNYAGAFVSQTGAFTYTLRFAINTPWYSNSQTFGLMLRDSGTGKALTFEYLLQNTSNQLQLRVWQLDASFQSGGTQPINEICVPFIVAPCLTLRVVDDGTTNRTYYYSADGGRVFVKFFQEARTTWITSNQIGFGGLSVTTGAAAGRITDGITGTIIGFDHH